jgi:hypothetical protein
MREWRPDAQMAMLKWLGDVTDEQPNPTNEIELWPVRKGERELTCITWYRRAVLMYDLWKVRIPPNAACARCNGMRAAVAQWQAALIEPAERGRCRRRLSAL